MKYVKKSLGQHFLIDKNVIKKIINLIDVKNKNVIEIGPGEGALTKEILKYKPKLLLAIEKDFTLFQNLKTKFSDYKNFKVLNFDILKFKIENVLEKNSIIFGNLPYNISSQILVKFLKVNKARTKLSDVIFMFQKELGDKIIAKYPSKNYGRISILTNFQFKIFKKFLVSRNCFFPRPKILSMIIHFKPHTKNKIKIKRLENLEKVTNILFSNKRKMINKNIRKILNQNQINEINNLNLNYRPDKIKPEIYYEIAKLIEK